MIIFHSEHWGALTHFILLAITRHKNDECILMFPDSDIDKVNIINNLVKEQIFNKAIFTKDTFPGAKLNNEDSIKKAILNNFDDIFKENNISISSKDTFYTSTDMQGVFRCYLILKGLNFIHVMLDAADIYDKYKSIGAFKIGAVSREYMNLLNSNNVYYAQSEFCTKLIAFPQTQITDEYKRNTLEIEIFDIKEELDIIPGDISIKLLKCFGIDIACLKNIKSIVLSNSEGFLWSSISMEGYDGKNRLEHVLLYQKLIDYYTSNCINEIFIKAHPNNYIEWENYFEGIKCIDKDMPIELIRLCKNIEIKNAVALQTTAFAKIDDKIEKITLADVTFARHYHIIDKLYIAVNLYKEKLNNLLFQSYGFQKGFFDSFMINVMNNTIEHWEIKENNDYKGEIYGVVCKLNINDVLNISNAMRNISENSVLIFLSFSENLPYIFANKDICKNMSLIRIQKDKIKSTVVDILEDEYILVYSKSKQIHSAIKNFTMNKRLQVTGVELNVSMLSDVETRMFIDNYDNSNQLKMIRQQMKYTTRFLTRNKYSQASYMYLINNFEEYINALSLINNSIVFIAVRDNAGKFYSYNMVEYIKNLGCKKEWNFIGWSSYLCIIDDTNIVFETTGSYGKPSEYKEILDNNNIEMCSKTYNQGDQAQISINSKDYAINKRGINIVVYDKMLKKVVDSVCFDTFKETCDCIREDK